MPQLICSKFVRVSPASVPRFSRSVFSHSLCHGSVVPCLSELSTSSVPQLICSKFVRVSPASVPRFSNSAFVRVIHILYVTVHQFSVCQSYPQPMSHGSVVPCLSELSTSSVPQLICSKFVRVSPASVPRFSNSAFVRVIHILYVTVHQFSVCQSYPQPMSHGSVVLCVSELSPTTVSRFSSPVCVRVIPILCATVR